MINLLVSNNVPIRRIWNKISCAIVFESLNFIKHNSLPLKVPIFFFKTDFGSISYINLDTKVHDKSYQEIGLKVWA